MDHDQQLLQLHEFDQQVLTQPENAHSYATKGFLETISDLIQFGLERDDDGSDDYKEELKTIKMAIRAFSTILPTVYNTVCQNEAESRLWEITRSLLTLVESQLIHHVNTGVKITSIKCLQVIILLFSKSSQLRADHRLLNAQELEKEGQDMFDKLVDFLKSDHESILTAVISCLVIIVKKRHVFLKPVINLFTSWRKTRSKDDSPVMLRNMDKALKLAFVSLIRTESLASYRSELIAAFGSIGGNVAMFQNRHARSDEARRQKRVAQQQHDAEREKRARITTEYVIPSGPNVLANYDITQIPLESIVNLCMSVLQNVSIEVMRERVRQLPAEGVTLAVTRPGFVRSTTPPYPPPPEQPQFIRDPRFKYENEMKEEPSIKTEDDSDEDMMDHFESKPPPIKEEGEEKEEEEKEHFNFVEEKKPKVEILSSVEERASQALQMKPYALTTSTSLSEAEKIEMIEMSIERILYAEGAFQVYDHDRKATNSTSVTNAVTTINTAKNIWLMLIAKLMTQNRTNNYSSAENNEDTLTDDKELNVSMVDTKLKEMLLDFVIGNIGQRYELALEWLYEEYLMDKRNQRKKGLGYKPNYFYWFYKLLEKIIPNLDAKDRILTKLLLDAPELDSKVIDMVKENLNSVPERFVSCISTLRNLVISRPAVRFLALQVLLDLCTYENDKMRRTSIVAVKKWNENQVDIGDRVEAFSIEALNRLTKEKEEDTMDTNEKKEDVDMTENDASMIEQGTTERWTEKDVVRYAELYFVLCTKRPSLLKELFSVYKQTTEKVQEYIRLHMVNMIKSIGMKSQDLIQLVREFPSGGETLVIRILSILCESKPPTRDIIAAVQAIANIANERSIDITSLSPILEGQSLSTVTTDIK
ncbi:uncharacterized protein BX663DRAFT_463206 [Cokeromyces recurvatus]|uniref:uncharacterized protein n=1 Tax=Cokeromyces recurvatus TaxID=90255 RepID=UPI002220F8B7|nr:uncharacterized protein BX663DRAFT_463206 [Cokeromyces recurvatus]KAI7897680.1 hypothetical protein BX663DRAFT_463206 [Cokeromyces recurvatus]